MLRTEVQNLKFRTQVKRTNVKYLCETTVYFFCSTNSSGTKGIRHVKNFVALLPSYRATFCAIGFTSRFCAALCITPLFCGTYYKWLRAHAARIQTDVCRHRQNRGKTTKLTSFGSFHTSFFNSTPRSHPF